MRRLFALLSLVLWSWSATAQVRFAVYYNDLAALVAANVPGGAADIQRVAVVKYTGATGDIDTGGVYYYDPASVLATNGITVLKPTNANGRWIRGNAPTDAIGGLTNTLIAFNVTSLAALNPSTNGTASLLGYTTISDGGGGTFYPTNTVTGTNFGTRIASTTAGWSWQRLYSGPIHSKWFGIGLGSANDTIRAQNWLNAAQPIGASGHVYQDEGSINITNTIQVTNQIGFRWEGAGMRKAMINVTNAFTGPAVTVMNSQEFELENFSIWANKLSTIGLLLDSSNTPPLSTARVIDVEVLNAVNDGVRLGQSTVNNYQIDHVVFEGCIIYGSKTNIVVESSNALQNTIGEGTQLSSSGANFPDYNIYVISGGVNISKASTYGAVLYDVRLGPGTFLYAEGWYSESDKPLIVDFQASFLYPTTIINMTHNANFAGSSFVWDRNGPLHVTGLRSGGDFYVGSVNNGIATACLFNTGRGFIGPAVTNMTVMGTSTNNYAGFGTVRPAYQVDSLRGFRVQGTNAYYAGGTGVGDHQASLYARAVGVWRTDNTFESSVNISSPIFSLGTSLSIYTNATGIILQVNDDKDLRFYNNLYGITGFEINTNGAVEAFGSIRVLSPTAADASVLRISGGVGEFGTIASASITDLAFSKILAGQNNLALTQANLFISASVKELQSYSQSTTFSWDLDGNRSQFLALTNNTTVSFVNVPTLTNVVEFYSLTVTNTGAFTLVFTEPANGRWPSGEPTIGAGGKLTVNAFWDGYELVLSSSIDGLTLSHFNTNQFSTNNVTWPIALKTNVAVTNLTFPATQIANTGTNTLDDYEEGTWTPTDVSGASLALTVVAADCIYTKIGRQVTATFNITFPVTANGATAQLGSLPFTSQAAAGSQGGMVNYTDATLVILMLVTPNATSFTLYKNTGAGITNLEMSTWNIRGTVIYQASQ